MKKKLNQILDTLEKIEETQQGQLQGGFSSFGADYVGADEFIVNRNCKKTCINNCHGSNCSSNCGHG